LLHLLGRLVRAGGVLSGRRGCSSQDKVDGALRGGGGAPAAEGCVRRKTMERERMRRRPVAAIYKERLISGREKRGG